VLADSSVIVEIIVLADTSVIVEIIVLADTSVIVESIVLADSSVLVEISMLVDISVLAEINRYRDVSRVLPGACCNRILRRTVRESGIWNLIWQKRRLYWWASGGFRLIRLSSGRSTTRAAVANRRTCLDVGSGRTLIRLINRVGINPLPG
jgi:hypothetical protein